MNNTWRPRYLFQRAHAGSKRPSSHRKAASEPGLRGLTPRTLVCMETHTYPHGSQTHTHRQTKPTHVQRLPWRQGWGLKRALLAIRWAAVQLRRWKASVGRPAPLRRGCVRFNLCKLHFVFKENKFMFHREAVFAFILLHVSVSLSVCLCALSVLPYLFIFFEQIFRQRFFDCLFNCRNKKMFRKKMNQSIDIYLGLDSIRDYSNGTNLQWWDVVLQPKSPNREICVLNSVWTGFLKIFVKPWCCCLLKWFEGAAMKPTPSGGMQYCNKKNQNKDSYF